MKRKQKWVIVLFIVINLSNLYVIEMNTYGLKVDELYKNSDWYTADPVSQNHPGGESYSTFHHREKIARIKQTSYDEVKKKILGTEEFIYQDGKLISRYSKYNEQKFDLFIYDEDGRLIKEGTNWTYKYPAITEEEKNEGVYCKRETYYQNSLQTIDIIKLEVNGYSTVQLYQESMYKRQKQFIINKEKIIQIVGSYESPYNLGPDYLRLEYDSEGRFIKETYDHGPDDIRSITTVTLYEGNNIIKQRIDDYRDGKIEYVNEWVFTNYDEYGNWHDAERKVNGKLHSSYHRDIDYIRDKMRLASPSPQPKEWG